MRYFAIFGLLLLPFSALAKDVLPEDYGTGLLCPHAGTQVTFYTENNQQDAAGTLAFDASTGFVISSGSIRTLKASGAQMVESLCAGGVPGVRIDSKRDGWLQAGRMWMPPSQEWEYGDWADFLRKSPMWLPLGPVTLYQGGTDGPDKSAIYPQSQEQKNVTVYPLKFTDDGYALVLLDEGDAFGKRCKGTLAAPQGRLGWMRLNSDDGRPVVIPANLKGC